MNLSNMIYIPLKLIIGSEAPIVEVTGVREVEVFFHKSLLSSPSFLIGPQRISVESKAMKFLTSISIEKARFLVKGIIVVFCISRS